MVFRADLHCHSTCSDGSDSPDELLCHAKKIGLAALSITDHDTVAAYTPELFALSREIGVALLPGIELSSEFLGASVHLLGYGINPEDSAFCSFLREAQKRRRERNEAILELLRTRGISLDPALFRGDAVGRPHIAKALVERGYVATIQEAFRAYLRDLPGFHLSTEEGIKALHAAGGKAILAHPHFYQQGKWLKDLLALPWDGVEGYYGTLKQTSADPWISLAKRKGWLVTGGSDYHGALKPAIPLGASWVGEEVFRKLLSH
ncbi:MAG: PHP domain-containing protein [Verrucomicrobiota bacterium]|nr:PHP domain-containing protein [Verrucomicrobiota bacterium]